MKLRQITENVTVTPSQGDGYKIATKFGYIEFRPRPEEDINEIWWVESHKKGHGFELVDMMQKHSPASHIAWGATSQAGEELRQRWHAANPMISGGEGRSVPHEGQFNPFEHDDKDEFDDYDEV